MTTHSACAIGGGSLVVWGVRESPTGAMPFHFSVPAPGRRIVRPSMLPPQIGAEVASKVNDRELQEVSESLVDRARCGDQNAMAILMAVSKNAQRGVPRALRTFQLCKEYIARPLPATIGADDESDLVARTLRSWLNSNSIHRYPQLMVTLPLLRANLPSAHVASHVLSLGIRAQDLPRLAALTPVRSSFVKAALRREPPTRIYGDSPAECAEFCGSVIGFAYRLQKEPETIDSVAWELGL